jgi:hypothetical protein
MQDQLRLKLEPAREPTEVLIIDQVEGLSDKQPVLDRSS